MFESILFNKANERLIQLSTKTKLDIESLKDINDAWKMKFECLELKMKSFIESTKCDINTRHNSIKNQNQMVNFNT